MDEKPVIYLVIEVKARELEGRGALAFEAATRGYRVVLGSKNHIYQFVKSGKLPPGLFFEKSLTQGKESKLREILHAGCSLASQDEESGLLGKSYDDFISFRSSSDNVDMADAVFCWGNHDHNAWVRHYPDASHKVYVTGSPRVDYWRPEYTPYFQKELDSIRERFSPFVLLASNFGAANGYMPTEELIRQRKNKGGITTEKDAEALRSEIRDQRKMFEHFAKALRCMAKSHQVLQFVVRPHPAERLEPWKEAVNDLENVHVLFEGGISSWVRAASVIWHNGCTTGIEAYVSEVPAIAYVPFESLTSRFIPNQLSIECKEPEDVSAVLSRIGSGEPVNEHRNKKNDVLIHRRLANVKGKTAVERIVDVLEVMQIPRSRAVSIGIGGIKFGARRHLRNMMDIIRGRPHKVMRSKRKFPGLTLRELAELKKRLSTINQEYIGCSIKHLYGDVFMIEKTT